MPLSQALTVRLARIAEDHSRYVDTLLDEFKEQLDSIVQKAQARTIALLQERLTIVDGAIASTRANARILRSIDLIFREQMEKAGYDALVQSFTNAFAGQLPFFEQTLALIREASGQELSVTWPKSDLDVLSGQQAGTVDSLTAVVERAGAIAQQRALFSFGGLAAADLAETLAAGLGRTLPEAVRIGDTAMSVYYRTLADRGFQQVEAGLPAKAVQYSYYGPDDKVTRPFCRHLLENAHLYTRDQIEHMSNGQLPNPFLTGGGYNCRHSWLLHFATSTKAA